jgi:hypothetical protein
MESTMDIPEEAKNRTIIQVSGTILGIYGRNVNHHMKENTAHPYLLQYYSQ